MITFNKSGKKKKKKMLKRRSEDELASAIKTKEQKDRILCIVFSTFQPKQAKHGTRIQWI